MANHPAMQIVVTLLFSSLLFTFPWFMRIDLSKTSLMTRNSKRTIALDNYIINNISGLFRTTYSLQKPDFNNWQHFRLPSFLRFFFVKFFSFTFD